MRQLRILLALVLLFVTTPVRADDKASIEFSIKAVVLFNFAKYVRWPDSTFTAPDQPIRVCIAGKSPVSEKLNSSEAPTEAQGRPFAFKEISVARLKEEAIGCQILYWNKADNETIEPFLPALHQAHVLTVADSDSRKSIITFTIEDGKVRFKIRRKEAEKAALELGSQLLKLAILDDD
jgi:hypothetical protein